MIKLLRIFVALSLICIGVILIASSSIYGEEKKLTPAQDKALDKCVKKCLGCWAGCEKKSSLFYTRCTNDCDKAFSVCTKAAGIPNAPLPPRVHTPEKATPGQKVESTPKPTPRDKAPSGKVIEQSSPTPKATPSLKKKGTIEKQGM